MSEHPTNQACPACAECEGEGEIAQAAANAIYEEKMAEFQTRAIILLDKKMAFAKKYMLTELKGATGLACYKTTAKTNNGEILPEVLQERIEIVKESRVVYGLYTALRDYSGLKRSEEDEAQMKLLLWM